MLTDDSFSSQFPEELLDRYIAGECAEEELVAIRRWMRGDSESRHLLEALRHLDVAPSIGSDQEEISQAWSRVIGRYRQSDESLPRVQARSPWYAWSSFKHVGIPVVAGLILTVAAVMSGWQNRREADSAMTSQVSVMTYATRNGQRADVTLPDGSVVSLSVASRLRVPMDFMRGNRTVTLDGEALFTVTSRGESPFAVVTRTGKVQVLGTSFLVRHYPADSTTFVAVREGKVSVRQTVLAAAQAAVFSADSVGPIMSASPEPFTFVTGTLTLDRMLLPAAIVELNRWYDADIRLGDPALAGRRITGECAAGSLADLAAILAMTLDVRVVRQGRIITLYPR